MPTYDWSVNRSKTGLLSLQIRGSAPRLMDASTLLPEQQEGEEEEEGSVGGPQLVPADSGVGQSGIHSHFYSKATSVNVDSHQFLISLIPPHPNP